MSGLRGVRWVGLLGAGLAVLAVIGGGCAAKAPQERAPEVTEAPAKAIPSEAKEFIAEYGVRYTDPLSTYYAEKAYRDASDQGSMITDAYVAEYDMSSLQRKSDLGFARYELPFDVNINTQLAKDVFNDYTAGQLTIYMNTLARNPQGKEVVDRQFEEFCSELGNTDPGIAGSAFTEDDAYIENLMATFASIVNEHGSNAHYTVTEASDGQSDALSTHFNDSTLLGIESDGVIDRFQSSADVVVLVDVYDKDEFKREYVTLEGVELTVIRGFHNPAHFGVSRICIGQVK
jgi:hypothetical protein